MFNWLSRFFPTRRKQLRQDAPHLERVALSNSFQLGPPPETSTTRVYEQSPWVYIAINRIAEAGALAPLKVYRLEGERRVGIDNHPLEQLLGDPNPLTSRFELFEQTLGSLELQGNAYWFLAGDARGRPAEIWLLRPDRMTIVPDPRRVVAGYLYEVAGQHIPLDAVEVAHFRRWHPNNDFYGLSPIAAARGAILSDRHMADWNRQTFGQDQGVPAGIVSIRDYINDADFERIKREWLSQYGGTARKTAFLRGGAMEWQNIGLSHTDLDFLQGRRAQRDEILNIFGIPVGLVSENATEANAKVAERQFIERTLWPKLARVAQKISAELLLSINELRAQYFQLPPVEWGDVAVGGDFSPHPPAPSPTRREGEASNHPPLNLPPSGQGETSSTKSVMDELAQWERFALNRLDKAEQGRPFEVSAVPDELAFEVSAGLLFARDRASVKSVFAGVRAGLGD